MHASDKPEDRPSTSQQSSRAVDGNKHAERQRRKEAAKAQRDEAWEARRKYNNARRREKNTQKRRARAAAAE